MAIADDDFLTHACTCTIGQVHLLVYYIKLKSRLSVCLSVRLRHADISAVSARIETGFTRNESCVFEDHKVYF